MVGYLVLAVGLTTTTVIDQINLLLRNIRFRFCTMIQGHSQLNKRAKQFVSVNHDDRVVQVRGSKTATSIGPSGEDLVE